MALTRGNTPTPTHLTTRRSQCILQHLWVGCKLNETHVARPTHPSEVQSTRTAILHQQDLVSMHYKTHVPARFSVEDQMSEVTSALPAQEDRKPTDPLALL